MKYMRLFCDQPSGGVGHIPPDEAAEYGRLRDEAVQRDAWVTGAALMSDTRSTRVQTVDGEVCFTDGPFAEVTDLLSGMFVIDVDSHEAALEFAARIPAARNGAAAAAFARAADLAHHPLVAERLRARAATPR